MPAKELAATYGKGYTKTSLYQYVQFYRMFPEIVRAASGQSRVLPTWTQNRELLRVQSDEARAWYEQEATSQGWSVKQLSRNISSQYCERMLSSGVEPDHGEALASSASERAERLAFVKSPMVMEFRTSSTFKHGMAATIGRAFLVVAFASSTSSRRPQWQPHTVCS